MSHPASEASGNIPPEPWFLQWSRVNAWLMGAGVFAVVFLINLVLDYLVANAAGSSTIGYIVSDAVAGGIATFFVLRVIRLEAERRETVRHRLYVIAEMNHHLRNSLEAIQMSAQLTRDREMVGIISDEVNRIQWALREVLGGEETSAKMPASPVQRRNE